MDIFFFMLIQEFYSGLPEFRLLVFFFITLIIWTYICTIIPIYFKSRKNYQTGLTRKIFHFLIFGTAALLHIFYGYSIVCLFGIIVTFFLFLAIVFRKKSKLYLALAREKDEPHKTLFIIIPYFSTLAGGLVLNYYYPEYAFIGYLICGIADASGEVIGTLYGRHKFKVYTLVLSKSFKSIEGSLSVFLFCLAIISVFIWQLPMNFEFNILLKIIIISFLITVVEIITPRGLDNFTVQYIPVILLVNYLL